MLKYPQQLIKWTFLTSLATLTAPIFTTLSLFLITSLRRKFNHISDNENDTIQHGYVTHSRYSPSRHTFTYPIFLTCLDLKHAGTLMSSIWPLSTVARFLDSDHFRSGRGVGGVGGCVFESTSPERLTSKRFNPSTPSVPKPVVVNGKVISFGRPTNRNICLSPTKAMPLKDKRIVDRGKSTTVTLPDRLLNLIAQRTPTIPPLNSTVLLQTSLSYFGYCFNPVSFYYIFGEGRDQDKVKYIVAEVSNTPWNEEELYVLAPESVDVTNWEVDESGENFRFVFDKRFHVSPFIGTENMVYDWEFKIKYAEGGVVGIKVVCRVIDKSVVEGYCEREEKEGEGSQPLPQSILTTNMVLKSTPLTPWTLTSAMIRYPLFCAWVQALIHFEAVRLMFFKGVKFVPHPKGSVTRGSELIEIMMRPVFWLLGKR